MITRPAGQLSAIMDPSPQVLAHVRCHGAVQDLSISLDLIRVSSPSNPVRLNQFHAFNTGSRPDLPDWMVRDIATRRPRCRRCSKVVDRLILEGPGFNPASGVYVFSAHCHGATQIFSVCDTREIEPKELFEPLTFAQPITRPFTYEDVRPLASDLATGHGLVSPSPGRSATSSSPAKPEPPDSYAEPLTRPKRRYEI